jgi:hypothetical protein
VLVCHVPRGNPENAHVISISVNALKAHEAHDDKLIDEENTEESCGAEVGPVCEGGELAQGTSVEIESDAGTAGEVDVGDVLLISGGFDIAANGTISVTLEGGDGTQGTFTHTDNADVAVTQEGDLRIAVTGEPINENGGIGVLDTAGLVVDGSQGVTCEEEEEEEVEGTIGTTEAGDTVLKTSSGDVLKLEPAKNNSKQAKQRLKGLKGQQVKVEGKLQDDKGDKGKTLKQRPW